MRFKSSSQVLSTSIFIFVYICDLFNLSDSLQCWECVGQISVSELRAKLDTNTPFECGDPFTNTSAVLDNCDERSSGLHQPLCRKTIMKIDNQITFKRTCDLNHDDSKEQDVGYRRGRNFDPPLMICDPGKTLEGGRGWIDDCWCSGDGCNSFTTDIRFALGKSPGHSASSIFVIIISLIIVGTLNN